MPYKDPEKRGATARKSYRKHKEKNREARKARALEYYYKNKDLLLAKQKDKYDKNPEYYREYREKHKEDTKEYYKQNKSKINTQQTERHKIKRKTNPVFKLLANLRRRIHAALTGEYKSNKTVTLLGRSVEQFKIYIEDQFTCGMSWWNYSINGWHIDHILDCRFWDLTKPEEQELCFNYRNMQPMWSTENLVKGHKKKPDNFEQLKEELRTRILEVR